MPAEMWDAKVTSVQKSLAANGDDSADKMVLGGWKYRRPHHHSQSLFGIIGGNGYYNEQQQYSANNYNGANGVVLDQRGDMNFCNGGAPQHQGNSPNGNSETQVGNILQSSGAPPGKTALNSAADCYWFAQSGDSPSDNKSPPEKEKDGADQDGKDGAFNNDREERVRVLRERQAEERYRKLEELKSAAMHAQKFREVQEEERRRKIEEIKYKDLERRHQVEERKRQIWEAEKERRETILRKSQEREARIEGMRNAQRSSIGFAFGSCTPRLLELETSLMVGRRSSSQTNVMLIPTTNGNRSTANEQAEVDGVRRRTTSAYSLDHRKGDPAHRHTIHEAFSWENNWPTVIASHGTSDFSTPPVPNSSPTLSRNQAFRGVAPNFPWDTDSGDHQIPPIPTVDRRLSGILTGSGVMVGENLMTTSLTSLTSSVHRGRRKTDLIPTMPPNRESPRTRSPGRAFSMTRLDQLSQPRKLQLEALREERFSQSTAMSKTKSMTHLAWRKGGRNKVAGGNGVVEGQTLRASRSADPRMSKSTTHLAMNPSSATGEASSTRTSPTRTHQTSASTSPGRSLRGSSPGSEGSGKRMSQSMWQLAPATGLPRPTRSSILRRDALTFDQKKRMSRSMMHLVPKQKESDHEGHGLSPRAAPSSPSRPQSSLSQLSLSSHASQNSSVSMRARSAPRRQRPLSVAGSRPDKPDASDERRGRSSEKRTMAPQNGKPPRAKSVGADKAIKEMESALQKTTNAPLPTPRRSAPSMALANSSKATTVVAKEKPKISPKPTVLKQKSVPSMGQTTSSQQEPAPLSKETTPPLQVNGSDMPLVSKNLEEKPVEPAALIDTAAVLPKPLESQSGARMIPVEFKDQPLELSEVLVPPTEPPSETVAVSSVIQETSGTIIDSKPADILTEAPNVISDIYDKSVSQMDVPQEALATLAVQSQAGENVTLDGNALPKPRITTEEEAKAALAEKRRLAREQAEREAELERLRLEELRRQEEERLRREEEEQRLWEQEQERSRLAEQERLQKAIEEQQQREEEERLRREEEAKQKAEKEKAERLAKEEQEKLRKEAEEKLRKEEEERAERRKRVEAIMSRTRNKGGTNTPPVTTPTKSIEPAVALAEQKESDASTGTTPPNSIPDSAGQNSQDDGLAGDKTSQLQTTQPDLLGNIAEFESRTPEPGENGQRILEQQQNSVIKNEGRYVEENGVDVIHTNGFTHHETVNSQLQVDLIMDSQSTPEKKASPMSDDLAEFDLLAPKLEPPATPLSNDMAQLIDLSLGSLHNSTTTAEITAATIRNDLEHISNEDNVNFNITTTNGLDDPFVDNYAKHQESVTGYLS